MRPFRRNKSKQSGAASLIFVLLIALVMTASTDNAVNSLKNSQEIGTAVNAISHAQTGAWVGAEAMRIYLQTIDNTSLEALGSNQTSSLEIEMDAVYGSVMAKDITVTKLDEDNYQISLKIVNKHLAARSSATLQLAYNVVTTYEQADPVTPIPTVSFNDNLNINGSINLLNGDNPINLTVNGDVMIDGASVNPINELHTTGKVTITGSALTIDAIYADDDVVLANTKVKKLRALGDVTTSGSAEVLDTIANGDVRIGSGGRFEYVSTQKNIIVESGNGTQGVLVAGETIVVKSASAIDSLNAIGKITLDSWGPTVGDVVSMSDIKCVSQWWKKVGSLSANGSLINCPSTSVNDNITAISGANNTVTPAAELTPRSLPLPDIDVWQMMDEVNYFVEYDNVAKQIKVTVNSVKGIPDGSEFTLAEYVGLGAPYKEYLCASLDATGKCSSPNPPTLPLCFGQSLYNDKCITYNNGIFTLNPNQTVTGIVFFDGDLVLGNGHSMTTILASGNIHTNNQFEIWAANRGGYSKICEGNADHATSHVQSRYEEAYSTYYPTNLCDSDNEIYTPLSIGNVALAAGGINPDTNKNPNETYTGGNISLGANTEIWGAVLAGNFLDTSGDVNIKGLVNSGAFGDPNSGNNALGASTTIDLQATDDYDPLDIPIITVTTPSPPKIITTSVMTWARPL